MNDVSPSKPARTAGESTRLLAERGQMPLSWLWPIRSCTVSFEDGTGIRHSVQVTAESLFEAAALALRAFGENESPPGPAAHLEIAAQTQQQFMQGLDPAVGALDYGARCRQVRELGGDCYGFEFAPLRSIAIHRSHVELCSRWWCRCLVTCASA